MPRAHIAVRHFISKCVNFTITTKQTFDFVTDKQSKQVYSIKMLFRKPRNKLNIVNISAPTFVLSLFLYTYIEKRLMLFILLLEWSSLTQCYSLSSGSTLVRLTHIEVVGRQSWLKRDEKSIYNGTNCKYSIKIWVKIFIVRLIAFTQYRLIGFAVCSIAA